MRIPCAECGGEVEIQTDNLGPWAGRGLLPPARALDAACIRRLALTLHGEAPSRRLWLRGVEFREYRGGFVHSDSPSVRSIYDREPEKKGEEAPHGSTP